jgi:DNA-binding transcriptional ArsR family regulator
MMIHMDKCHDIDRLFHALADPTRRGVVEHLMQGPQSVSALHRDKAMALPPFLKHLRVLEESGLIETRKTGRVRTCTVRPEAVARVESWAVTVRGIWQGRLDRLARHLEGDD